MPGARARDDADLPVEQARGRRCARSVAQPSARGAYEPGGAAGSVAATRLRGVGIRADAIPLEGPLEGGSEGASVIVEPIEAGRARFPRAFFEYEGGRLGGLKALGFRAGDEDYLDVPVPSYLVRHPTAGPMLIDTGLHPSVARDPRHNMGRRAAKYFSLEPGGRRHLAAARDGAWAPATSRSSCSPTSTSTTPRRSPSSRSRPSSSASPSGRPRPARGSRCCEGYHPAHYDHAVDYRTVDFGADYVDSYGPFGRTMDLFGDGTVRLAFTPGHTPGHMSVLLRLPRRDFVVAGRRRLHLAPVRRRPRALAPRRPPQLAPLAARGPGLPRGLSLRPGRPRPRPGVLGEAGLALRGVTSAWRRRRRARGSRSEGPRGCASARLRGRSPRGPRTWRGRCRRPGWRPAAAPRGSGSP